jgi:hypothetical protein
MQMAEPLQWLRAAPRLSHAMHKRALPRVLLAELQTRDVMNDIQSAGAELVAIGLAAFCGFLGTIAFVGLWLGMQP